MEEIKSKKGNLIALIIRKTLLEKEGPTFISHESFPLQLGTSFYQTGKKIAPHRHLTREIKVGEIQEVVYFESGRAKVDLYDEEDKQFDSIELGAGDLILFTGQGGHGFDILEATKIIEVKQGPYLGKETDKKILCPEK